MERRNFLKSFLPAGLFACLPFTPPAPDKYVIVFDFFCDVLFFAVKGYFADYLIKGTLDCSNGDIRYKYDVESELKELIAHLGPDYQEQITEIDSISFAFEDLKDVVYCLGFQEDIMETIKVGRDNKVYVLKNDEEVLYSLDYNKELRFFIN